MNTCRTAPGTRRHRISLAPVGRGEKNLGAPPSALASSKSASHSVVGTSVMPPSKPLARTFAQEHKTVRATRDEGGAAAQDAFALGRANRQRSDLPTQMRRAVSPPGAQGAGRVRRRADGGAEIHHGLGEIAGAAPWRQRPRQPGNLRLGRRQRRCHRVEPRDHPFDIAVDRRRRRIIGDRGNGGGGIGSDAGQLAQRRFALRNCSAVALDHGGRAGMQISRAGVIAEPGPGLEDVIERRRREPPDVGPARKNRA